MQQIYQFLLLSFFCIGWNHAQASQPKAAENLSPELLFETNDPAFVNGLAAYDSFDLRQFIDLLFLQIDQAPFNALAKIDLLIDHHHGKLGKKDLLDLLSLKCWGYYDTGNYTQLLQVARSLLEEGQVNKDSIALVSSWTCLSLYDEAGQQLDLSLDYSKKPLDYYLAMRDTSSVLIIYNNLGDTYIRAGQYDLAQTFLKKAEALALQQQDDYGLAAIYYNFADLYIYTNDFTAANSYLQKSIRVFEEWEDVNWLSDCYINLGKIYLAQGLNHRAEQVSKQAFEMARTAGFRKQAEKAALQLFQIHEKIGNFQKAIQYQKYYINYRDSLLNRQQEWEKAALEKDFLVYKKEQENKLLQEQEAKNLAIIKRKQTQIYLIGLSSLLAFLLAAFTYKELTRKSSYNRQLEKKVAAKTEELLQNNERLLESNQQLERFAYITYHDLKEPLRNIISFTGILSKKLDTELPLEEKKEYLQFIKNSSQQLYVLMQDIQEYARLGSRKSIVSDTDPKLIFQKVEEVLMPLITEKNGQITWPTCPPILTDPEKFLHILINLVENGLKYNYSQPPVVKITYHYLSGFHHLTVTDNGVGIDEHYAEKIFDLFKRLHNRRDHQGSGLGLAICKKMVADLGGKLWFQSQPGQGSAFHFTLPSHAADAGFHLHRDVEVSN